jgi:hypothetical protein
VIRGCLHPKFLNQVFNRFPKWPSLLRKFARVPAPESRTEPSLDSRIGKSPKSGPPTVEIPGFRMFMTPHLRRTKFPELCTPANSRLRRSQSSCIREFPAPEKHTLRMPLDFNVSRVMYFPEFPNTQPTYLAAHTTPRKPSRRFPRRPSSARPQDSAHGTRPRGL